MGESKHTPFACRKCHKPSGPTGRVDGDRSLCAECDARQQELCRLADEAGEQIAKERAAAEAESSARWRDREGKRLRLEQAAPLMLEALRAVRDRASEPRPTSAGGVPVVTIPAALLETVVRAAIKAATGGEPRQRHDWILRAHADRWECVHGCGTPGPYKAMTPPDAPCSGRGATGGEP